jgi:hypothetical protein
MGERTVMQEALFYSLSLEDHVPRDYLLRSIDRSSIWAASASIFGPFTARQAGLRSTGS